MSITYPNINFIKWWNFHKYGFNRTDLKLADLLCEKHNFYTECLFMISTVQNLERIRKNKISKLLHNPTVAEGRHRQQKRLSRCVFSQIFTSLDISQTGTDIENPSGDNVHDMDENNLSKYRSDPMVEGGVIAIGCSAINMSSLQSLSKLSLTLASPSKRENRMIFIVLTSC